MKQIPSGSHKYATDDCTSSSATTAESKKTEMAIKYAKEQWQAILDALPEIILLVDQDGFVQRTNKALVKRLDCSFQDILYRSKFSSIDGFTWPESITRPDVIQGPKVVPLRENEYYDKTLGGYFLVREGSLDDSHPITPWRVVTLMETTEYHRAREKVARLEGYGEHIMEVQRELVCLCDKNGVLYYCNSSLDKELKNASHGDAPIAFIDLFIDSEKKHLLKCLNPKADDTSPKEVIFSHDIQSSKKYFAWTFNSIQPSEPGADVTLCVGRDITKRISAQRALEKKERDFRLLVDTIPDAVSILEEGKFRFCNNSMEKFLAVKSEDILGKPLKAHISPSDANLFEDMYIIARDSNEAIKRPFEIRFIRPNGHMKVGKVILNRLDGGANTKNRFLMSITDVTREYKNARELLRTQTNFLKAQKIARLGSWVAEPSSGKMAWSHELYQLLGISRSLTPSEDLLFSRLNQEDVKAIRASRQNFHNGPYSFATEVRLAKGTNHRERIFLFHEEAQYETTEFVVHGILQDITEQRELEKQIEMTSRLEGLGTLAGGIGHDFNNLLTGITVGTSLAKLHLEDENIEGIEKELKRIEDASKQAQQLARQLLVFSKDKQSVREYQSIPEILLQALNLTLHGSRVKVDIIHDIPEKAAVTLGDKTQIYQVLFNILLNAREAVEEVPEPCINILLREYAVLPDSTNSMLLRIGQYVSIEIEDNGVGIPEDTIGRIFDPFFTLKGHTGLGLSIVQRIVRNHGGNIRISSRVGYGTKVTLFFPRVEGAEESQLPSPQKSKIKGEGSILVMDDEVLMREALKDLLEGIGFRVECVTEGQEALNIYTKALMEGKPFRFAILDMTVKGGMGGDIAAERIAAFDPSARIILTSGYTENAEIFQGTSHRAFLPKPFSIDEITKALEACIG